MTQPPEIHPVTHDEFSAVFSQRNWGRKEAPELHAVRALGPGTGISFPCRWKHRNTECMGVHNLGYVRKQHPDWQLMGRCKDGQVYVWREA